MSVRVARFFTPVYSFFFFNVANFAIMMMVIFIFEKCSGMVGVVIRIDPGWTTGTIGRVSEIGKMKRNRDEAQLPL